jgi:predicted transcriptional regulator
MGQQEIYNLLKESGKSYTVQEMSEILDKTDSSIYKSLMGLEKFKLVKSRQAVIRKYPRKYAMKWCV